MNAKIVRTVHTCMHHKDTGFNRCTFTGLEDHRTDGQVGRSAALQDFDIWFFLEAQQAITSIGDFDGKGFVDTKMHVAVINFFLVNHQFWRATTIATTAEGEKDRRKDEQDAANDQAD
jgi:hypothetical protein